jgi:glycosyltransferase involved in cell wall biosynthesis
VSDGPLISVILPVYNAEDHLDEAISSIATQSEEDFECLLINDGSTDGSLDILESWQQKDARFRVISRENKGLVATLNEGVRLSVGRWIARMDADDICRPERFGEQLRFAQQNDLDIVGARCRVFGARSGIDNYPETNAECRAGMFLWKTPFCHPLVMAKREVFELFPYEARFGHIEDMELWARMVISSPFKMGNVPQVLLDYRLHEKQISSLHADRQMAEGNELVKWMFDSVGFDYSDEEFALHAESRLRRVRSFSGSSQMKVYAHFLVRLQSMLEREHGRGDLVGDYWMRLCKRNRGINGGVPLDSGLRLSVSQRLQLLFYSLQKAR